MRLLLLVVLGGGLNWAAEILVARFMPRVRLVAWQGFSQRILQSTTAVLTALLFGALTLRLGWTWSLAPVLLLAFAAVLLSRIDLQYQLLPNALVLPLIPALALTLAFAAIAGPGGGTMLRMMLGGLVFFGVYLLLALLTPAGLGMGDVKLAAPLGLVLGYVGWSQLFLGAALAFVLHALVSVVLVAAKKVEKTSELPFGPAMLATTLLMVFFLPGAAAV
ncbi:prepilin peptidase [Pseudarthrobacter sp. J1738]|uniref:prepilin peptidase n=1 Tax=Pseudarthrobacter sp. J1738 TaxID=3420446 RepID=UPI003D29A30F